MEGLDRDIALNLWVAIVSRFYDTLSNFYHRNSYSAYHIWKCDEIGLQVVRNCGMQVITRRGIKIVPNFFPKSRECITILRCVNAVGSSIHGFYLLKGKSQLKFFIKNCEV